MAKPEIEFDEFPKINRLNREVIVTEKLDGTNAAVYISDDGTKVFAASRTRWIDVGDDNKGFAAWVNANREELKKLGPGYHFGEWWGSGIGRGYGLKEKRFSLFNVARWQDERPSCCEVVPVLWRGMLLDMDFKSIIEPLRAKGSVAAPGFMSPEGVVIFHAKSGALFKYTFDHNDEHKGVSK